MKRHSRNVSYANLNDSICFIKSNSTFVPSVWQKHIKKTTGIDHKQTNGDITRDITIVSVPKI